MRPGYSDARSNPPLPTESLRIPYPGHRGDQHGLEVLACAAARPPVYVPFQAILEPEPAPFEDVGIEPSSIVHDDEHGRSGRQGGRASAQNLRDPYAVLLDRRSACSARRRPELALAAIVKAEQLVGIAVLLVVVDEAGVRRRGEDGVVLPSERDVPCVAV